MSTQHTPGPWLVYKGEVCYRSDADDQSYGMFCPVDFEQEANARLIAAAPDLLEALIEVRAYLSKCPPHAEDITGAKWGRVMDLSGAALNRAEGKS